MKEAVIAKAIDYIDSHLDEGIKLEDISRVVGYSKYHFNRMFAQCTGQTMHRYIKACRLTKAARNLIETDRSIVEIAFEAGYDSQQSFTLAFRQAYCHTPRVYRRLGGVDFGQSVALDKVVMAA